MQAANNKRIAVVTGGCRGIGLVIAQRLAREGYAIGLWDNRSEVLAAPISFGEYQAQVYPEVVDVTDEDNVARAVERLTSRGQAVSVLVNNAGINGPTKLTVDYSLAEWRSVVDVNLIGAFICSRALLPLLAMGPNSRIVNIASIAGKEGNAEISAYSAAKAGLIGFTKSLAKEVLPNGILVNAVAPAMIETDLLSEMTQEYIDRIRAKIPMGRLGKATEVAAAVAWLCSPDCSFSTGTVLDLSGGRATY